jgi:PAS domain S-box-containing protein
MDMDASARFEQLYKHLLAQTRSAVFVHDEQGRIVNFNHSARVLLGYDRDALQGHTLAQLVAAGSRKHVAAAFAQVRSERPLQFAASLQCKSGDVIAVKFSSSAVDFDGRSVIQSIVEPTAEQEPENSRQDRLNELDMVFSLTPNGLALIDHNQRIQVANPAFARFLERTVGQVIGMSVKEIEAELNGRAEQGQLPLSLSQWEEQSPDETLTSPPHRRVRLATPKQRTVKCQFRTLGADSSSAILALQDITREDEIDRLKTRFLSAAAHELRNPMASISGFADLLMSTPQDSDIFAEIVETIQTQALSMSHLVDELLELTRMGALGARDLALQRIDIEEWVATTVRQFRRPNDDRQVAVTAAAPIPPATGDPEKLTRALTNVLSNAFKYSSKTAPVSIHLDSDSDFVNITVHDQGIGMSADDIARICDPFYRASAVKSVQGTGLGMSLVLEILNSHDGRLDVQSHAGNGSSVTLSLPR